jgi:hypothetical protein
MEQDAFFWRCLEVIAQELNVQLIHERQKAANSGKS